MSVVIATYNRGERIGRTLESVFRQTKRPAEVIVVDDGSTDDTAAWIRARYPQVSVVAFPNGGSSVARNRGARAATGDILVFLDHDDEMRPEAIETLVGLLKRFPQARASFGDHELRNLVDRKYFPNHHTAIAAFHRMRSIATLETGHEGRVYGRAMYYALLQGNILQQPWAIYRQDFTDLGGYDPQIRYCEDWEYYVRVTRRREIAVTDRVIAVHFIEGQNLHRVDGQEIQHMNVLRKHIRSAPPTDWRAVRLLRKRLAVYYKSLGDRRRATGVRGAWHAYVQSLLTWPFDLAVAARCFVWSIDGLKEARGDSKLEG